MSILSKNNFYRLCKIFSFTLLLSSTIPNAFAEELDYYSFPTGEQEGGGVRGRIPVGCDRNTAYPVPLVPQNFQTLTTSSSPKLFFSTANVEPATTLDFLLLDRDNEIVYQDLLKTNDKSGLVGINLSDSNSNALKINNNYHWYLVENCQNSDTPKIIANGSIKRIELEKKLATKLTVASTIEKINIYQSANIWHEAVENLTQLKCGTSDSGVVDKQLEKITDIANISTESLNNSLNTYCTNELKPDSIVMK